MTAKVDPGLSDWQAAMGRFAQGADERIKKMLEQAAETVADDAQRLVPRGPSGAARASLRAVGLSVVIGGPRAPYGPWLEFGGAVGRKNSVKRTFVPGGRYIWPTWTKDSKSILEAMEQGMVDEATEAGL